MIDPNTAKPSTSDFLERIKQKGFSSNQKQTNVFPQKSQSIPINQNQQVPNNQVRIPDNKPPTIEYQQNQPRSTPQPTQSSPQTQNISYQPEQNNNKSTTNKFRNNQSAFEESGVIPGQFKPIPEEVLVEWKAPIRPFKKRNRQFYTTIIIISLLISLILFFAGQMLPIAVVISIAFLAYILSSVPPENEINKITTHGIRQGEAVYYWMEMGRYWFETKYGQRMLKIEVARFPNRLTLMLGDIDENELSLLLSEALIQEKPKETNIEKAAKWLQEKIPLETT